MVGLFFAQSIALLATGSADAAIAQRCLDLLSKNAYRYSIPCGTHSNAHYFSISVCGDYLSLNNRGYKVVNEISGLTIYSIKGKRDLLYSIQHRLM
ncbi:MAG TPA: hypothetical protein PLV25_07430, partial [Opitutales bacterium]|nr:hypothetical protein [Opitutales bacterium]